MKEYGKEYRKEYKIAYMHANRKNEYWRYSKLTSFRTLEDARKELARLRAEEERDRKAGKSMCSCGGFAIDNDYSADDYMIYRIVVREVTPFILTDD